MRSSLTLGPLCVALAACSGAEPPPKAPTEPAPAQAVTPAPTAPEKAASPEKEAPPPAKPKGPTQPLNVLLILVDSMRADMPWAGYSRPIAPVLTQLEKESISYTRAYAISSYTAKSVAGLLAGQYPSTLKRSGYFFTKYPPSNLFFPELLQKAGVATLSAHGHMYMKRGNGMDQGFDHWEVVQGIDFDNTTDKHITSNKLTPLAISQLEKTPNDKPFFMYLHYMDPHDQYVKHEESPDWGRKNRDRYDSEIFYTDLWIGKLLDYCKKQPWWSKTAVVVSADHGEAFGEHKMYKHAFELWDVLTHVPLFIRIPGVEARRIDTARGHIDLAPTIMELMGVKGDPVFAGKSLVPEVYGAQEPQPRPVLMDLPADSNNPERRALVHGDYKLIAYGNDWRFDLYNLKDDPGELRNLARREKEKLEEMKKVYLEVMSGIKRIKPFGGNKLMGGGRATGPRE